MKIGAHYLGGGRCEFVVWGPFIHEIFVVIVSPMKRMIPMNKDTRGYWRMVVDDIYPGSLYLYQIDRGAERPDPASHFQPRGVHGPSLIVDHRSFQWDDSGWGGIPLEQMIIYEVHIGTFTLEGDFDAAIDRLDDLARLGVNAVEVMPVAQFPGERNWGYDGTYPFAVQNSYGGPEGFKKFVNACHKKGVSVILDVVYNHFGPEGNYTADFAPYITKKYNTPWGGAINYDDSHSDEVRNYFIENALYWFLNYHIDAIRLDAIHSIFDMSPKPFLQELVERVKSLSKKCERKLYCIAENDLDDVKALEPVAQGGYGIDAVWCDDYHHCVHTMLTHERGGYYKDFGRADQFAKAVREGYVYSWEYSEYRKKHHGSSSKDFPGSNLVVFSQNHDQIGNRMLGDRLSEQVSFEALKLAAGAVLLSPYIPLIFMGEEYGEDAPFLYFVSHADPFLINAVREGRKQEFASFSWKGEPPDPQDEGTFLQSKLNWETRDQGRHKLLLDYYQQLISLRKSIPALSCFDKKAIEVINLNENNLISVKRWKGTSEVYILMNFNNEEVRIVVRLDGGGWNKLFDSADELWNGDGSFMPLAVEGELQLNMKAHSLVMYEKAEEGS
ncbi:MAG: malto-oligosyltrehalose trehalohydrolase [Candidatus Margulisiibacteriota bacterium]|nr:MAG: malto-oligosyltrehalose trehalohydrolase [Candidatus Margulisbacteria bacterium GWF2_38_17]OGI11066.1 MAG: malto-oligosyltrehalose trehalohydrolase [Candidatus Margulisbacteria bacterium GWE2_39_32]PZM80176.1 MAG: malto-oligosyltrehalose trehalohydrolase [Candidatus Margulisiibacteriota bacterium]HCY35593.1 malto-oligosyltrehalose trehalohydrolase [Candidatus Margulisiibacteriota bacterium]